MPDEIRTKIRALHTRNLNDHIFDYSTGLALRDTLIATGGIDAGIWLRPIRSKPKDLFGLHGEAFRTALPFTWFIIEHFMPRSHHGSSLTRNGSAIVEHDNDRVRRIVTGDERAIRELIDEVREAGEEAEPPATITILPRHTMTVKVSVGKSLSSETARVYID